MEKIEKIRDTVFVEIERLEKMTSWPDSLILAVSTLDVKVGGLLFECLAFELKTFKHGEQKQKMIINFEAIQVIAVSIIFLKNWYTKNINDVNDSFFELIISKKNNDTKRQPISFIEKAIKIRRKSGILIDRAIYYKAISFRDIINDFNHEKNIQNHQEMIKDIVVDIASMAVNFIEKS